MKRRNRESKSMSSEAEIVRKDWRRRSREKGCMIKKWRSEGGAVEGRGAEEARDRNGDKRERSGGGTEGRGGACGV